MDSCCKSGVVSGISGSCFDLVLILRVFAVCYCDTLRNHQKCLHCENSELKLMDYFPGLRRYQCPHCGHSFHRTDARGLCDSSSPINLPIYSLLFRVHSNPPYEVAQQCRMEQDSSYLKYLLEEIRAELDHPSQRSTDIHNDTRYSEAELREFLRLFAEELRPNVH